MKLRLLVLSILVLAPLVSHRAQADDVQTVETSFEQHVKPFLQTYCADCHNAEEMVSGIRLDHLTSALEDRHLKLWEHIQHQVRDEAMPPDDADEQPSEAERRTLDLWISQALTLARSRPRPKNGNVRRLTVAQYRNTLRELLLLNEDLASVLPPDAISKDGFVNNRGTLAISPLQLEAYLKIADKALSRCLVDEETKPVIQNFRMDLGAEINSDPCPDELILGAGSLLLQNQDFVVTQLSADKPFPFEPFSMKTEFRFIEGYIGNGTIREWKDFHGIYHAVFACMRGSGGYPKGHAYSTVPEGLLLRPAIPAGDQVANTFGPKANFKISLRELPDDGRFRVTVTAAKYRDGLMLDPSDPPQAPEADGVIASDDPVRPQTIAIPEAGIYQVDVYASAPEAKPITPDASRLTEGLVGAWALDGTAQSSTGSELDGHLLGNTEFVRSPFQEAASFGAEGDSLVVPRQESMNVGTGDFTIAAWLRPAEVARGGIVSAGKQNGTHGWCLRVEDTSGKLRFQTTGPDNNDNGTISTREEALHAGTWQHVAAVVRRGGESQIYVNGLSVGKGELWGANLDNSQVDLRIGNVEDASDYRGEIDEVRLYQRALGENEVQALVEPGRHFVPEAKAQEDSRDLTLELGERQFSGDLSRPAFLVVRLEAGELPVSTQYTGSGKLERLVFTPLAADHEAAVRFAAFEKRSPRIGVHVGLRRDCGTTMAPVGDAQTVAEETTQQFVFEGAIRNFPSPEVEEDNVNYLAGVREIGVRSEYTDGRDMPRLLIRSIEFEGPLYETWPPASHVNLISPVREGEMQHARARRTIRDFASRAFRRPVIDAEVAELFAVYEESLRDGGSFQESVKDALQVALTSPQFLFLIEHSSTPEAEPLDDYELASKLSYFLWNGPPDRGLVDKAAAGTLRDELDAEVNRLIRDRRFEQFTAEFVSQWLALEKFQVLEPDTERFPRLNRNTRAQLEQEPVHFVQHLIRNNLPVRQLIESDFVMANEVVASFYDLQEKPDSGFAFVPIAHQRHELGGVLSQAAIMAGLSDGRESNPVKRGTWLARRIVAEPPDDPPPNVPALDEEMVGLSLRQRLEQHRNQPGCAQCHSKIDPWGIPFEEFDAGGRLKTEAVDASSTLPDKTDVNGFGDLRRYLAEDRLDQVAFSVLKHLATYAVGRDLSYNELDYLKQQGVQLRDDDYRMQDLIRFVVSSPLFLEK